MTDQIVALVKLARNEGELVGEQFLHWFLQEQREEVASMTELLAVVERGKSNLLQVEEHVGRTAGGESPLEAGAPPAAGGALDVREIRIRTERRIELVDITREVRDVVAGERGSAVLVYVPHTTAGVTINEHADPAVARDVEAALERIVDDGWSWQHMEPGRRTRPRTSARRSWGRASSSRSSEWARSSSASGRGSSSASSTALATARSTSAS